MERDDALGGPTAQREEAAAERLAREREPPAVVAAQRAAGCRVCGAARAAYVCPRCAAPYCRAACYRAHGTRCTEAFFRQCIEAEIASGAAPPAPPAPPAPAPAATDEDGDALLDLAALELKVASLAGDSGDVERALSGLPVERLEALLSARQLARFRSQAAAGQLNGMIGLRPFIAWWDTAVSDYEAYRRAAVRPLISAVTPPAPASTVGAQGTHEADEGNLDDAGGAVTEPSVVYCGPAVWFDPSAPQSSKVARWREVTHASLSSIGAPLQVPPSFAFHAASVLLAYVMTLREFNGEWLGAAAPEAAAALIGRAGVLRDSEFQPVSLGDVIVDAFSREAPSAVPRDQHEPGSSFPLLLSKPLKSHQALVVRDTISLAGRPNVLATDAALDALYLVELAGAQAATSKATAFARRKLWFIAVWLHTCELGAMDVVVQQCAARLDDLRGLRNE
jgi:hypothetical protein